MILYGAPVKEKIKEDLIRRVKKLGCKPCLAIVQVGDRPDSSIYIKNKRKFGEEIGVEVLLKNFNEDITEKELIEEIKKLNGDKSVDGIIVQLPLPACAGRSKGFDSEKIINLIDKRKDVDGLVSGSGIIPATARAVISLLNFYNFEIKDKKAAVIGQSILAGKPIADELEKRGAKVFRCDINTKNPEKIAKKCDLLISAVGKAGIITEKFINPEQVVIDVGINKMKDRIVGDVDFTELVNKLKAISPVPGGIGPLTIACLFQNLSDLCYYNL
ncbi:MAG: bifunctional 5,10-methylenetetrahydrofolate dehydrogenase/5,10-methenyltetrahydrofolate cyclohydrolase [Candidatus Zambryskibacteria bacterium]|nr:bifunctional 5,10-methylenetetrahydrofolate dehydrogenase/5,10-methenyltetrahydrofolate cyclohydrolase [Candidatus Zambryskibacteria bacterium]